MRLTLSQQIMVFTLLSWLGEYVHNVFDLPHLTLLSPENSIPALISALLILAWFWLPYRRAVAVALLVWAFVHLIGGAILSIIPLSIWPFFPAQTVFHYLMHALYGLAQLPLIIAVLKYLRRPSDHRQSA